MKVSTLLGVARACVVDPRALIGPKQHLFLVSHMRSYSSLLAHLLGSHPQIAGHSERLLSYTRRRDLLKSRFEEHRAGDRATYTFLLDKVLHDYYALSDRLLAHANVRLLVFVRRPAPTLVSTVAMWRRLTGDAAYADWDWVAGYYTGRLGTLLDYARRARLRPLYFDAERIVDDTPAVLEAIGQWLGLRTPLTERYTVFADTGERYRGDPSDRLRRGQVVHDRETAYELDVPPAVLDVVEACYRETRRGLEEACRPVRTGPARTG